MLDEYLAVHIADRPATIFAMQTTVDNERYDVPCNFDNQVAALFVNMTKDILNILNTEMIPVSEWHW